MIEAFSGIAGAVGLSTSAGLNAYLPLLAVGLVARYTDLIHLNSPWDVLTSGGVIAVLAALLLIEMTADKIPAVDTLNDGIQTVGRPLSGAVLFAAGSGMVGELHPLPAFITGLFIAGSVHAAKTVARPVVTVTTGGMGNWLVSLLEDMLSLIIVIVAILVPVLVLFLVVAVIIFFARGWSYRNTDA
jgi:hypothetical protein